MDGFIQDLRHGARLLIKSPGFTFISLVTLALGIGANTAIFSAVRAVLIRPLPFARADRIVALRDVQPQEPDAPASYPEYVDWKASGRAFTGVAAEFEQRGALTGAGDPLDARTLRVSAGLLDLLGVQPALGRGFLEEEERADGPRAVILCHALWQERFGSDPGIVGKSVTIDGQGHSVIGVLPAGFRFGSDADLWLPLRLDEKGAPRGLHFLEVFGRLRDGLDLPGARSEIGAFEAKLRKDGVTKHDVKLVPIRDRIVGDMRWTLVLLQVAVGLVLLIACINVANLALARSSSRRGEIAVRFALGAGRARLIRQLLTESLLLALLGGGLGLLLASWGTDLNAAIDVPGLPRIGIDGPVLAFTLVLSVAAGLLFGLTPAWQSTGSDLNATLKQGGRDSSGLGRGRTLRTSLVLGEIALSLVLLVGSGLLLRSFLSVLDQPMGFNPQRVLALDLYLGDAKYKEPAKTSEFFARLLERVRSIPAVESAGLVSDLPLAGTGSYGGIAIDGKSFPPDSSPVADKLVASPGYFGAMGIRLLRGRDFDDRDREGAQSVAIINGALADKWFPGEDPVGKRIDFQWNTHGLQTIVGVVGNARMHQLETEARPAIYLPFAQHVYNGMSVVARTASTPADLVRILREQVDAVDRDQPVSRLRTMDSVLSQSLNQRRAPAILIALFAGVALILAALGIYGLTSFSVAQRTREIGLRMALGARAGDVLGLVLREGLSTTLQGILAGLLGSLVLTRFLSGMLFGVSAADPMTFVAVALLLSAVALLATYIPARRATRVDPMVALRHE